MADVFGYQQAHFESVSQITATPSVELGSRRIESGNEYVYVYNMSTSTAKVGYGVCQSAASAFSITVSGPTGNPVFGVVQNTDLEPVNYGWVLVRGVGKGHCEDSAVSNHTAATAMQLFKVEDGGFGGITTGATGSTWAAAACGYALASIATGVSGSCYFNCLG
jgi:hypothetical protein